METEPYTLANMSAEMVWWLLTKPSYSFGPRCQTTEFVCKRPMWGDGRVNGDYHGLCSLCWHAWNAWHGKYVTFRANPAALLDASNINRLRFNELPEVEYTFPEDWNML